MGRKKKAEEGLGRAQHKLSFNSSYEFNAKLLEKRTLWISIGGRVHQSVLSYIIQKQ
jgi:hypothetical protein